MNARPRHVSLEAMQAAITTAVNNGTQITLRYGKGSTPGTLRTVMPIAMLDGGLFTAVQVAPEKRTEAQHYRISVIIELHTDTAILLYTEAAERSNNNINYFNRRRAVDIKLAELQTTRNVDLPDCVVDLSGNTYLWKYGDGSIYLRAPSPRAIALFVLKANVVIEAGGMGGTWIIIDAMFEHQIDWPEWYRLGLEIKCAIACGQIVSSSSGELEDYEFERLLADHLDISLPEAMTVSEIARYQGDAMQLYAAIEHVPIPLMLAFIHDVRPQHTEYHRSMMSSLTVEQAASLYDYGLAEVQPFTHILELTNIADMRQVLESFGIALPASAARRQPHVVLVHASVETHQGLELAIRRKRNSHIFCAPAPLTWDDFHELRAQVIRMGRLLHWLVNDDLPSNISRRLRF